MNKESLKRLIDVAAGRQKADLVITNCKIIDVCSGQLLENDIAIADGYIAGIGSYKGKRILNANGKYAAPGLIDAHIHIESSYCTPEEFGRMVVPHGTTTVIADPHEIVNVCGINGFKYMLAAAKKTALSVKLMMPSCVPATALEDAGAVIKAENMKDALKNDDVPGLGELMDYVAVGMADSDVLDKLILAKEHKKVIDGHSPNVFGNELNSYVCSGVKTDHECSTIDEMMDRLSRGVYVQLRQGSACHNLKDLSSGINDFNFRRCLICSDDRQPKTIFEEGHLECHLRMLIEAGIEPIKAIAMATINAADCYKLDDRGMIAPGKRADIVIFEDLNSFKVNDVIIKGEHIAHDGVYLKEIERVDTTSVCDTVNVGRFDKECLRLKLKSGKVYAIEMVPGGVLSKKTIVNINIDSTGDFVYNDSEDIVKCAVLERHHQTGKVGLGFIKGYGMKHGAIAASVAHDSHNIICVGVSNDEMSVAIEALIKQKGGFVVVKEGKVLESLALPIAGLMSDKSGEEVAQKLAGLHKIAIDKLNVNSAIEPIMTLTFMSLIVIPELKITARGIFDVAKFKFIDLDVK